MLDAARQVIRWSNPGWLFFIFLSSFMGSELIVRGSLAVQDPWFRFFGSLLAPGSGTTASYLLLIGALGLPVGFMLYQVYYWGYWRWALGRETPIDKGYAVLKDLDLGKVVPYLRPDKLTEVKAESLRFRLGRALCLDDDSHTKSHAKRSVRDVFSRLKAKGLRNAIGDILLVQPFVRSPAAADRLRDNWFVEESVWYRAVGYKGSGKNNEDNGYFETHAVMIADIYHALGAARVALLSALIIYGLSILLRLEKQDAFYAALPSFATQFLPGLFAKGSVWIAAGFTPSSAIGPVLFNIVAVFWPFSEVIRSTRRTTRLNLIRHKREYMVAYFYSVSRESVTFPPE